MTLKITPSTLYPLISTGGMKCLSERRSVSKGPVRDFHTRYKLVNRVKISPSASGMRCFWVSFFILPPSCLCSYLFCVLHSIVKMEVNTQKRSVLQGGSDGFGVDLYPVARGSVLGYRKREFQILPELDKDVKNKTQVGLLGTSSLVAGSHVALSQEVRLALLSQKQDSGVHVPT